MGFDELVADHGAVCACVEEELMSLGSEAEWIDEATRFLGGLGGQEDWVPGRNGDNLEPVDFTLGILAGVMDVREWGHRFVLAYSPWAFPESSESSCIFARRISGPRGFLASLPALEEPRLLLPLEEPCVLPPQKKKKDYRNG